MSSNVTEVAFQMIAAIRLAQSSDFERIANAYHVWGYGGGIKPEDTAWMALIEDELIGVVRFAPENGTLVLRGMRIEERWRRQGIGSRILHVVDAWLANRECYCVPYVHLLRFYGQIGFAELTSEASPSFLSERMADYSRRGLSVTIMRRPAAAIG